MAKAPESEPRGIRRRRSPRLKAPTEAVTQVPALPDLGTAIRRLIDSDDGRVALQRIQSGFSEYLALAYPMPNAMPTLDMTVTNLGRLNTRLGAVFSAPADLSTMAIPVSTDMDPRLQLAVLNRRSGKVAQPSASTSEDEIAVIARVTSPDDWEAIPDVVLGRTLGPIAGGKQSKAKAGWVVTGRIPVKRIEAVRRADCVLSLKASQPVYSQLSETVREMLLSEAGWGANANPSGGAGVVVGIVDFGCDFTHLNFRRADGSTRILALWDQSAPLHPGSPSAYGRVYGEGQINAALQASNPFENLGYPKAMDGSWRNGTHGTHVTDIAAGNGLGSGQPGAAPEADIVFVEADASDIAWDGPEVTQKAFGDSVQLLEAVRFIFDVAGDRPCVVNLSLGTNGGPHDGTSLVEQGLDAMLADKPNRSVVIAASNSQSDGIHTTGQVPVEGDLDIGWIQEGEFGGEFELWYAGERRLEVTLVAPDGTIFGPVNPGDNLGLGAGDQPAIFISSRVGDPNNGDNVIGIWIARGVAAGRWVVRLQSVDGTSTDFHAWIERMDRAQSHFEHPTDTHTLGSISTGRLSVTVGSYDAHKKGLPLSSFSSAGPTRDGREKPGVSAPGHSVFAARSLTKTAVVRMSGTSMAAPAVTGLIALILAEASRTGTNLKIDQIRSKLIGGVLSNPSTPSRGHWHPRYGYGRASGKAVP